LSAPEQKDICRRVDPTFFPPASRRSQPELNHRGSEMPNKKLFALVMILLATSAIGQQIKSEQRTRFLKMFAHAYFPGRTGHLLIVPREGDIITRPEPEYRYMHASPWSYDVSIPMMFVGPAVKNGI